MSLLFGKDFSFINTLSAISIIWLSGFLICHNNNYKTDEIVKSLQTSRQATNNAKECRASE
jgi:hypothetical protein